MTVMSRHGISLAGRYLRNPLIIWTGRCYIITKQAEVPSSPGLQQWAHNGKGGVEPAPWMNCLLLEPATAGNSTDVRH
jgi:hypothetical protein